jgi:protein TonB
MKSLSILLSFVLFGFINANAQTPAELNAQLRQELLTVKAKCAEIKPVFEKMKLAYDAYSDSLLNQFKAIPFSQLVDSYLRFKSYQDSTECINRTYSKTIPFDDLLNDKTFPARNKYTPCMISVNEVLNVKHDVNYYPHDVVLGQKPLEEENRDLEESIQGYIIKNSRMLLFLDEAQSGFNKGMSVESSIDYLKAAYELKLTEVNQYTAVLKDTVAQARKLYLANPETSKYKHCFYKEKLVSYSEPPKSQPVIFSVTDEVPEFIGGREAMNKYLSENLVYPESAKKKGIEGKVYLKFVISESGNISNVKIQKGIPDCPECDTEAIRVVNNMPDWTPAKTNGKPVNSWYNLPVAFKIQ